MAVAKEWAEIAAIVIVGVVLGLFGLTVVLGAMAAILASAGAMLGALFGGMAGGAFVAFKWIMVLAGWWL